MVFLLVLTRRLLLTFLSIAYSILIALVALSFIAESGTAFEGISLVVNTVAFLLLIFSQIHKYLSRNPLSDPTNTRGLVTFGLLWLISLVGSVVLTIRSHLDGNSALFRDFSMVRHGHSVALAVLVLSWLATLMSVIGLLVCYIDELPGVKTVTNTVHPMRVEISPRLPMHIPPTHEKSYSIYTEYPSRTKTKTKKHYPPPIKTSYDHWDTVPV